MKFEKPVPSPVQEVLPKIEPLCLQSEDSHSGNLMEIDEVNIDEASTGSLDKQRKWGDIDVECVCCGAVLSEAYGIWFRHRYYCCRECLPEETSRGYRLVSCIVFLISRLNF